MYDLTVQASGSENVVVFSLAARLWGLNRGGCRGGRRGKLNGRERHGRWCGRSQAAARISEGCRYACMGNEKRLSTEEIQTRLKPPSVAVTLNVHARSVFTFLGHAPSSPW